MENPFALLGLPETAELDEESIKSRFLELSREQHPDSGQSEGHEAFVALSQAYQTLRSPAQRLRTKLTLVLGESFSLKGPLPNNALDLFSRISTTLNTADAIIAKKKNARSGLAEALLAPEILEIQEELGKLNQEITTQTQALEARFPEFDQGLATGSSEIQELASQACRLLIYLERWRNQIQARFHGLI